MKKSTRDKALKISGYTTDTAMVAFVGVTYWANGPIFGTIALIVATIVIGIGRKFRKYLL